MSPVVRGLGPRVVFAAALVLIASSALPAQAGLLGDIAGSVPPLTAGAGSSDSRALVGGGQGVFSPVAPPVNRRVVLIAGICSSSEKPDYGMSQMEGWLRRTFGYRDDQFIRFSYSQFGWDQPYRDSHTVQVPMDGLAANLRAIYRRYPDDRFFVVAHSLGGLVAAYAVSRMDASMRARTSAVLTFNSPLRGYVKVLPLLCLGENNPRFQELKSGSPIVSTVEQATWADLPLLNFATLGDLLVPYDRARVDGVHVILKVGVPTTNRLAGNHSALLDLMLAPDSDCEPCADARNWIKRAFREELLPYSFDQHRVGMIKRLYRELLGRVEDDGGLVHWYRSGLAEPGLRQAIMASDEYRRKTITGFYRELLGREPDAPGLDNWVNSGLPLDRVRQGFLESQEYGKKTRPQADFLTQSPYPADLRPGQRFDIYFEVRNSGNVSWRPGEVYLRHVGSGDIGGAPARVELPGEVPRDRTVRFRIDGLVAPAAPGSWRANERYRTHWQLQHSSGGFGPGMWIGVEVAAQPTAQPAALRITDASITVVESGPGRAVIRARLAVHNDGGESARTSLPMSGGRFPESYVDHAPRGNCGTWRMGVEFERTPAFPGPALDHPWRWGFTSDIPPRGDGVAQGEIELTTPGTRSFYLGLVEECVRWWQDGLAPASVTVAAPKSPLDAHVFNQSTFPELQPGQRFSIFFEARNTGSTPWRPGEVYLRHAGSGEIGGAPARVELPAEVPVGGSVRLEVRELVAPAASGDWMTNDRYRTYWQLQHPSGPFGPLMYIGVTVRAPAPTGNIYSARYTPLTIPSEMRPGGRFTAELQVTNTSAAVWAGGGANAVYFAYRWFKPDGTMVARWDHAALLGRDLLPSETLRVTVNVEAPSAAGTYILSFDAYHEGKGYFSEFGAVVPSQHTVRVEPLTADIYSARYLPLVVPNRMRAGERASARLQVTNTSSGVWPGQGYPQVFVFARWLKPDGTEDASGAGGEGGYLGGDLYPGATVQLTIQLIAPQNAGTYVLSFDAYHAENGYFSRRGVPASNHAVQVEPESQPLIYSARYVPRVVPVRMQPGERFMAKVDLINTSTWTWPSLGRDSVCLGYRWHKSDGTPLDSVGCADLGRDLQPGETAQLEVAVLAPAVVGTHTLRFDAFHSGKGDFSYLGGVPASTHSVQVEGPSIYSARYTPLVVPTQMRTGEQFTAQFRITNTSSGVWASQGADRILVQYQWRTADGRVAGGGDGQLGRDLGPGESADVSFLVAAPPPGTYTLEISAYHAYRGSFADLGGVPSSQHAVTVQ